MWIEDTRTKLRSELEEVMNTSLRRGTIVRLHLVARNSGFVRDAEKGQRRGGRGAGTPHLVIFSNEAEESKSTLN